MLGSACGTRLLFSTARISIELGDGEVVGEGLTRCQKKRTSISMRQMASITADHPILASMRLCG
jgi:hypothetical protein